jgi:hypothetical protein
MRETGEDFGGSVGLALRHARAASDDGQPPIEPAEIM